MGLNGFKVFKGVKLVLLMWLFGARVEFFALFYKKNRFFFVGIENCINFASRDKPTSIVLLRIGYI